MATSSRTLRSYDEKLTKLSVETQAAGANAEQGLRVVEGQEQQRVARSAAADQELRDKYRGLRGGQ